MQTECEIDIAAAREFLAQKNRRQTEALDELYTRAKQDFDAIIKMIIERYRPQRIYQWGSLLDRTKFREYSDIDIAVEGVNSPELFFRMFGDAERLTNFPLDLLDITKIAPEFAAIIKRKGIVVYES